MRLLPRRLLERTATAKVLSIAIAIGLAALAAGLFAQRNAAPALAASALAAAAVALAIAQARRARALCEEHLRAEQSGADLEQTRQARRASTARLLSAARHEIRTPLSGILGMAELLLSTDLDAEQREFVRTLDRSSRELLRISDEILDFARLEIGELTLRSLPVDLWTELSELAELLAVGASERRIELVVRSDPTGPRHFLGDPDRLRQIFDLLARASLKSARLGPVLLDLSCRGQEMGRTQLRFAVESDGGAADFLTRDLGAGGPTAPAAQPLSAPPPLGLDLAERLAGRLHAELRSERSHSGGVRHWMDFELPVDPERPTRLPSEDLAELRILVADGSELACRVACELLEALGAVPSMAGSLQAALSELKAARDRGSPFQAALVAADLPGAGGDALATEIRRDRDFDRLTLIRLARSGAESEPAARIAAGFSAELCKPLRIDRLRELLRPESTETGSAKSRLT